MSFSQHSVVFGGTHQSSWDTRPSKADHDEILSGAKQLLPAETAGAEHLRDWVGLRPGRPAVRLERERLNGKTEVIHSYGHGGSGITIFWGCAKEVQGLVQEVADERAKNSTTGVYVRARL